MNKVKGFLMFIFPLLFLMGCEVKSNNEKIQECVDNNQDRFFNDPDYRKVERWCEGRVK